MNDWSGYHNLPRFTLEDASEIALAIEPEETEFQNAILFLLMALGRGNSYQRISWASKLDKGQCRKWKRKSVELGIFVGRKVCCNWFDEEHGFIALACDALCITGHLTRNSVPTNDPQSP